MKRLSRTDILATVFLLFTWILILNRLDLFPVFIDIYYHLSAMRGFDIAGGVVTHDFWEYAPGGRPHLYPPLLHVLMLTMYKAGLNEAAIGTIVSAMMYPLSQLTTWLATREIFNQKTALYTLVFLSAVLQYFTSQAIVSAAALVLAITPVIFYAIEKGRELAAVILMSVCLYTHLSMPHITAFSLLIYAALNKERRNRVLKTVGAAYLLASPWLVHVLLNIGSIVTGGMPSMTIGLPLFHVLSAAIGVAYCLREKKAYYFPVASILGMSVIALMYPSRFASHSILPMSILAGIALDRSTSTVEGNRKRIGYVLAASLIIAVVLFTPLISVPAGGTTRRPVRRRPILVVQEAVIPRLISGRMGERDVFLRNLLTRENLEVARIVLENSDEGDIIFTNNGPYGCFLTSFTGRSQTTGMFHEVAPEEEITPPDNARIIVIVGERGRQVRIWETPPPFLERIARIGNVMVLRRKGGEDGLAKTEVVKPIVPAQIAMALALAGIAISVGDILLPESLRIRRSRDSSTDEYPNIA